MMTKWKCCIKEPSELGKKVLCFDNGDCFVGMRFDDYYIPIPFAGHYLAFQMSKPKFWCEIDFPEGYNGRITMSVDGGRMLNMTQLKEREPDAYKKLMNAHILMMVKAKIPVQVREKILKHRKEIFGL